ncbi:unnamed protein product [Owenia fusiformis]|uniref:Uncharacterized protein n=1 Tax=Owenia fusiformis TaxID=6347 RepID=A0A8J1UX36_OWEFU|nr:unnamed protein product [Owenia fusiformis]
MEELSKTDCKEEQKDQEEELGNDELPGSSLMSVELNTTMATVGPHSTKAVTADTTASFWKTKYEEKEQFYKAEREAWDAELAAILDNLVSFENQLRLEQNEIVQFMNEKDIVVHRQTQHIKAILAVNDTLMEIMRKLNADLHMNNTSIENVRQHIESELNGMEALVVETKKAFNNHIQGLNDAHNFQTIPLDKNWGSGFSEYISSHSTDVDHIKRQTGENNSLANLKQTNKAISSKAPRKVIGKLKQLVTKSVHAENKIKDANYVTHDIKSDDSSNSSIHKQNESSEKSSGDVQKTTGNNINGNVSPRGRQRKVSVVLAEPLAIKTDGDQHEVWLPEKNQNDRSPKQHDTSLINSVAKNFGLENKEQRESMTSSITSTESDFDRDVELKGQSTTSCTDNSDLDDDYLNDALQSEKEDTVGELVEHHRRISVEANAAVVGSYLEKGLTPREVKARDKTRSRSLPQTVNLQFYAQQFTNITDV